MKNKYQSDLTEILKNGTAEPLEVAKYFLSCYEKKDPTGFIRLRDAYLIGLMNRDFDFNEAWGLIHENLYHAACIADDIKKTGHVGIGQLMLPEGYGAAEIAKYFRDIFNYNPLKHTTTL